MAGSEGHDLHAGAWRYGAMMATHTIFYSWQSDLPNSTNRGFIEDCLERAMKELRADEDLKLDTCVTGTRVASQARPTSLPRSSTRSRQRTSSWVTYRSSTKVQHCWPDTLRSIPPQYTKKPLLRNQDK